MGHPIGGWQMFQRENAIGLLLLGLCAFMAGVLIYSIVTGTSFEYTGPRWIITVLSILFIAGIFYGLFSGRGRGGRGRWPDPMTGRKGWRNRSDKDDSAGPEGKP
jgi:hypothetical protein